MDPLSGSSQSTVSDWLPAVTRNSIPEGVSVLAALTVTVRMVEVKPR